MPFKRKRRRNFIPGQSVGSAGRGRGGGPEPLAGAQTDLGFCEVLL